MNIPVAFWTEALLEYAVRKKMVHPQDVICKRNSLLDLLKLPAPLTFEEMEQCWDQLEDPFPLSLEAILPNLVDHAREMGLIASDSLEERERFEVRLMGIVSPEPSIVAEKFLRLKKKKGIKAATDFFFQFCKDNLYIRMDRIRKNQEWQVETDYGPMQITINLSKPEKDPKEIAQARLAPSTGYPSCLLCVQNVGFAGNATHPARQNLRVIPLELSGERWYFQFSPYVYYDQHCIVLFEKHVPMHMEKRTFQRLLDFLDMFPHYFIGSNADLPIVGGSILSHEHFQGGVQSLPMASASAASIFSCPRWPDVEISRLHWPMSVVRLRSTNRDSLVDVADHLFRSWKDFKSEELSILNYSRNGDQWFRHNTITPIVRRKEDGMLEMDLVLRNNAVSQVHPTGIFHPHRDLHHIKKENIGLIEVMGLAILPGRLRYELDEIKEKVLVSPQEQNSEWLEKPEIAKHRHWINDLKKRYRFPVEPQEAEEILQREVGRKFLRVLQDSAVFKPTPEGIAAFESWIQQSCS